MRRALLALAAALSLASCGGGGSSFTPPPSAQQVGGGGSVTPLVFQAYDSLSGGPCEVSADGLVWYAIAAREFAPVDANRARCRRVATIGVDAHPAIPSWARPPGRTRAVFVATSLQEAFRPDGMLPIHSIATATHVPVTWMIGNPLYVMRAFAQYDSYHAKNGDDVEVEQHSSLPQRARAAFRWYVPTVSVEGVYQERNIRGALALGEHAFWGITWDSRGVDGAWDEGAPWGTYCADVSSYKRPSPNGDCTMLAFEWTARDLTRAYESGHDEYFSTDPDDVLLRAGFAPSGGAAYVSALVDAYAAAGEFQPLVMVSQQETHDMVDGAPGDAVVLQALYQRAMQDGMTAMTLAQAARAARAFSNRPRAMAFPFISGGLVYLRNGSPLDPVTLDYHDSSAGMTFEGGHTTPSRVFEYVVDPRSFIGQPLQLLARTAYPALTRIAFAKGRLFFHFSAPAPLHYGVALWADPVALGISGLNVATSGRAAAVAAFDLPAGESDQSVACLNCTGTTLPLAP
jgi:hypothetical protein